jgi:cell division transport system permease protein
MTAWLRQHRDALARAFSRARRPAGLLGGLVIGVALALPAGGYALLDGLRGLGARANLEPQVSVFLRSDVKRADAEALGAALRADRRIAKLRFVPREEALKDLTSVQGMPEIVAALGRNPLPDAYVVTAVTTAEQGLEPLVADLGKMPAVASVQADAVWARRLAALTAIARLALWLLAAVLGIGLIAVTFNTIGLQILTQREEIEVLRLIGATDSFIRRPFYYQGILQGVAGGLVALAIVAVGLALLNREVGTLAASYGSAFRFAFPAFGDAGAIAAFAGLIGWTGAHLSVSRRLREMDTGL